MQPGHPDIVDPVDLGAERARRHRRLLRDRTVARPGRQDRHAAAGGGRLADEHRRTVPAERVGHLGRAAGHQHVARPAPERGHVVQHLLDALAGGVDDLGVAGPDGPVGVDQGVRQLVVRRDGDRLEGLRGGGAPRGDGLQQLLRLLAVHVADPRAR